MNRKGKKTYLFLKPAFHGQRYKIETQSSLRPLRRCTHIHMRLVMNDKCQPCSVFG